MNSDRLIGASVGTLIAAVIFTPIQIEVAAIDGLASIVFAILSVTHAIREQARVVGDG